ncbi:MAG: hypothetical protein DMG57_36070 [Acidobacteria bacterium]|nr:MAG: hypothetical protein DMG57_36070 [Acidobacteriota bacterium]
MRKLYGRCGLLPVSLFLASFPAGSQNHDRSIFDEIGHDLDELTQVSGLTLRHRVPYDLISKEQVNRFLTERIRQSSTPEDLRIEELALKKFGFVPADFDLAKTTVDLLTEQAAAFYDYHKKRLYVSDWATSGMREAALVHELAHALADQNFRLEHFISQSKNDDDLSMAHMAVMEGQATWLMSEVQSRRMGKSLKNSPESVELMSRAMEGGGGEYPVFESAPLYLRRTLLFPYTQGILFQSAVVEKSGTAAFAQIFRQAPVSTQQILHPDKYFAHETPSKPELPDFPKHRGYKRLVESTIGELDFSILLAQYFDEARAKAISPYWRGGTYALYENQAERRAVLVYAVDWNDPRIAREYFDAYQEILQKKWKRFDVQSRGDALISGSGDGGYFVLRLDGAVVRSLEGLKEPGLN